MVPLLAQLITRFWRKLIHHLNYQIYGVSLYVDGMTGEALIVEGIFSLINRVQ
ncbi:hypothetical protein V462_25355 [Pantoea ananatis 15320]|nr:hypothetical protein V462_25355 [Pantoea ananatis 15320]